MGMVLEYVANEITEELAASALIGGAMGGCMPPVVRDLMGFEERGDYWFSDLEGDMMQGAIIGVAGGAVAQGVAKLPFMP